MSRQIADILRRRLSIRKSFRQVFNTDDGKAVLAYLSKQCFMTTSTFVAGDPHQSAMNEGSRRVVLSIITLLNMDEKDLLKQIQEQENEI